MKVEIAIYQYNGYDEYSEVLLEIEFDLSFLDGSYEIIEYKIDDQLVVNFHELLEDNHNLRKNVADAIEDFIINYEPDYMDCE